MPLSHRFRPKYIPVWLGFAFRYGLILCFCLSAGILPASGQAGSFMRMGFGARGIALGNALVADASGGAGPYYNPALAPFAQRQNIEATVALLSQGRELQFLQFAAPLRPRAGVAVGLVHAGVSGIDGRDNSGYHTEDYSTDDFGLFLGFGTRMGKRVTAGVGLQLFRAAYFDELSASNSIGVDLGLSVAPTDRLRLGFALDDLLARYSWDTADLYGSDGKSTTDRFPTRFRVGAAYTPTPAVSVMAEYESRILSGEHRTGEVEVLGDAPRFVTESRILHLHERRYRAGVEWRPVTRLAFRTGVNAGGDDAARPSAGFQIEQPLGELLSRVDYAFVMAPFDSGHMHFITLSVFF